MWRDFSLAPPLRAVAAVGALVLLVSGCASFEAFSPPEVALVDISLSDVTLYESSGTFTVRLTNENREPMGIEGGVHTLYVGGARVGKGLSNRHLEVPGLGTATDQVEVHINNLALATRIVKMLQEPVLDYSLKSKIYVRRPYGLKRVRFNRSGRLELPVKEGPSQPGLTSETLEEVTG